MDSSIYVKRLEDGDEPPGWYRARVSVYDNPAETTVSRTIDLRTVDWLPCSRRAKRFTPLILTPVTTKSKQKPCLKY